MLREPRAVGERSDPTPEEFVRFERLVLEEARQALEKTRLGRYFPNSQFVITIENGTISARIKQQDFVLPRTT